MGWPQLCRLAARGRSEYGILFWKGKTGPKPVYEESGLIPGQKFPLGVISISNRALGVLGRLGIQPIHLLRRHITGDWGDLPARDRRDNEMALARGGRILSQYGTGGDGTLWVITNRERTQTSLIAPDEYYRGLGS